MTCHLVAHVTVADMIYGCCVVLRMLFETGLIEWTSDSCIIIGTSLLMATSACSGFGICLILVKNYFSVRHLNSNRGTSMTLCKAQISIVSFWIVMFTLQLLPVYVINQQEMQITNRSCQARPSMLITQIIMIISILTTMLFLMIRITLIVHKSLKNLFQGERSAADLHKQRSMKKRAKLATLFTIIALGLIMSWAPVIVSVVVTIICPLCVPSGTAEVMASLIQLNSCVNFIVNAIKDKSFKNVCMQLLKRKPNEVAPLSFTGTQ